MSQDQDPGSKISPAIKITGGNPTDEEIAAVVAVLTARAARAAAQSETASEQPTSGWSAYWRSVRAPLPPGPGSWQAAYRG